MKIEYYDADRVPDGQPGDRDIPWELFHRVFCTLTQLEGVECETGSLSLIENQYNSYERYIYAELLEPAWLTAEALRSVVDVLQHHPGWGLCIRGDSTDWFAILRSDKLLVTGDTLKACDSVENVVERVRLLEASHPRE